MKKDRKNYVLVAWIIVIIASCYVVSYYFFNFSIMKIKNDPSMETGNLPGKTIEEIQAEVDKSVSDGQFRVSINSNIEFEDGESEGLVRIENSKVNKYRMLVEIKTKQNDQLIYKSGIIQPGAYIEYDKLDEKLAKGSYPSVVTFFAYDKAEDEQIGKTNFEINIEVKK